MKTTLPSSLQILFFAGLAIFEIIPSVSHAQVTITSANMPVAGQTYFSAIDTLASGVGNSGANQQWNFASWNNHGTEIDQFSDPALLYGFPSFPSSNLGLVENGNEIFLNNSASEMNILGFYGDFGNGPAPLKFIPSQKFISFPSNFQTSFSGNFKYIMAFPYSQPPIDSVMVISHINYTSLMDSWGTITTPSFSNLNSLRQKYTEIKTDSIFVRYAGAWIFSQQPPSIDTTIYYRWWSDTNEFTIAEIVTDGNGNVTSAKYLSTPPPPVVITFISTPSSGCAPLTVTFDNTSTGAAFYQWYFGDGSSQNGIDTVHTYTAGGYYWAALAAYDANYNYLGNSYTVIYVGGSAGFFEMASDSVCPGDAVDFRGQDIAIDYEWNFGDGSNASGDQWATHTFNSTGTYAVSLIVTTSCGIDTIVQNIFVGNNVSPESGFDLWPSQVCPNQPVNVYSSSVGNNYQWNFGDGSTGSGQQAGHSYPNLGNYVISCIVTNSCGLNSSSQQSVSVVQDVPFSPYMNLNRWPQPACPGTEIFFEAPSDMSSYIWDFGDGSAPDTSSTNENSHSFSVNGDYLVSVIITDFCGNDTTITTTATVNNSAPFTGWFQIQINPSPACPGSNVDFSVWSNDAVSYLWNFGDGNTSTSQSADHVYPNAGNYNTSLTMTNSCGSDTTIYTSVNVNNNVIPNPGDYDYGVATDTACSGDSVLFYIGPSGSGTYLWNFGDGTSTNSFVTWTDIGGSVDIATHIYANNGTYNVSFSLTNQCGNSFSDTFSVTIGSNVPVDGDLWINGENFCDGDTVKFNSVGGITYVWNFGDGSSPETTLGIITEIFHTYSTEGEYPVSVNINNSCGNSATYYDTISIDNCIVISSDDIQNSDLKLQFSPNPNNGKFMILAATRPERNQSADLRVFNILGEVIYTSKISDFSSPVSVDISQHPDGVYFLQFFSTGKSYHSKFIKE